MNLPRYCRECGDTADWTVSIGGYITTSCDKHLKAVIDKTFERRTNQDLRGVFLIKL